MRVWCSAKVRYASWHKLCVFYYLLYTKKLAQCPESERQGRDEEISEDVYGRSCNQKVTALSFLVRLFWYICRQDRHKVCHLVLKCFSAFMMPSTFYLIAYSPIKTLRKMCKGSKCCSIWAKLKHFCQSFCCFWSDFSIQIWCQDKQNYAESRRI